jgi:hypothetical protein
VYSIKPLTGRDSTRRGSAGEFARHLSSDREMGRTPAGVLPTLQTVSRISPPRVNCRSTSQYRSDLTAFVRSRLP